MKMNKQKTVYICSKCDAQLPKWSGRCLECGAWGTIKEAQEHKNKKTLKQNLKFDQDKLIDFNKISSEKFERLQTNIQELEQIFGGGIVKGSLTLIGGEPGIGKSTLVLQILQNLEPLKSPLLYISGEESAEQIKLRLNRLNYKPNNLKFFSETNIEQICSAVTTINPAIVIIDSIQTVYSNEVDTEAGNVSQIRACTAKILAVAKTLNIPTIITGHVTKDGAVAGPKTLEHLVDTVIYIEGDKLHGFRIVRAVKNRFGSTNEIGIFEMTTKGLIEVKDPSKIFLNNRNQQNSGSVVSCFLEGTRPFLVEVQALVSPTIFGFPQRKAAGYDLNRLQMISAVLLKRAKINLANQDIHLNITGGVKVKEPALDLAVATAIISAYKDKPFPTDTIILGEIGLGGEIRSVFNLEKRLQEAEKLGLKKAIIPDVKINKQFNLEIKKIKTISEI